MYKLIALDMDGTLLNKNHKISKENKEAIKKAREKGTKVVLASGRPIDGLEKYLKELDLITEEDYVMSFNGSLVQKVKSKEAIVKTALKGSDLLYLYELSKELNVDIHGFSKLGCITPRMNPYSDIEGELNDIKVHLVDFDTINPKEDIIKVMMVDEPKKLDEAMRLLPEEVFEKYNVVKSAPYFLEFMNKETSKGTALKVLADELGLKKEEIIGVGDAGNDLDMIKYAGLGVAMGNGFEEVKAVANFITKTNEEHGVAHVIEKFILNQ